MLAGSFAAQSHLLHGKPQRLATIPQHNGRNLQGVEPLRQRDAPVEHRQDLTHVER
jgi:hypothetical protein